MSGSLSYITTDLGGDAFNRETEILDQQRTRREGRMVDQAIRSGVSEMIGQTASPAPAAGPVAAPAPQQPQSGGLSAIQAQPASQPQQPTAGTPAGPYGPVLSRLAQTPGGGQAALHVAGQNSQRQERALGMAMQAFSRGEHDLGVHLAQQGGGNLPPELLANAGMTQRMGVATTTARRMYGNDRAAAQRFVQSFMATGDINAATAAGGTPQAGGGQGGAGGARGAGGRMIWADDGSGQATGMMVDRSGRAQPVTGPNGQPVMRAPGAGNAQAGRTGDRQARLNMLRAAGYGEQEANAIAGGAVPTPNAMTSAHTRVQQMITQDFTIPPDQKAARVAQSMETMFGPGWQARMQGRPPAPQAQQQPQGQPLAPTDPGRSTQPAAPAVSRPPSVPLGSQYSPSRRMWRDPQGRTYDQQGNPL